MAQAQSRRYASARERGELATYRDRRQKRESVVKLPSPYVCDECKTPKRDSNHWWLRVRTGSGIFQGPNGPIYLNGAGFLIVPWDAEDSDKEEIGHLCSESCATKALSKWMASLQSPRDNQDNAQKPAGLCSYCGLPFEDHTMPTVGSGRRPHLFQSANAQKPQPAKDSPKERQSKSSCQAVMTNYDQGPNIR